MTINDQLDNSLCMIEKRKKLLYAIQQKEELVQYLNTPVLGKRDYGILYPSGSRMALRVISNVIAILSAILLIVFIVLAVLAEGNNRYIRKSQFNYGLFIIPGALFLLSAVLGTIAFVLKANAYGEYLETDHQYRIYCQNQISDYQQMQEEISKLENLMNNTSICIVPKNYWDSAEYISAVIKSGQAKTVEQAILLMNDSAKR